MRIDDYGFEQCARVVFHMNESAQERYDSWEELHSFMLMMAYQYAGNNGCTHFATGGFCLTFMRDLANKEEIYVTATVQPYTALRYIERVAGKFDTIRSIAA
jgi:hypothetical protein